MTSYPPGRENISLSPERTRPTRALTGFCLWLVPRRVVPTEASAATCAGLTLEGPLPNRPSDGFRLSGIRMSGTSVDPGGPDPWFCGFPVCTVTCASMTGMVPPFETATVRQRISARVGAVAPSATLAVDARAKALRKSGHDVIGFGAGEPDFPTPANIVEAAVLACRDPANHHYTPTAGLPELREQIAVKTARDSGYEVQRVAGPRHERCQAGRLPGVRDAVRPW